MTDPVTLNGLVYDREFVEDWIFENDWTDPGIQNSQSNTVTPDDIQECKEEFLEIFQKFTRIHGEKINQQESQDEGNDADHFEKEFQ